MVFDTKNVPSIILVHQYQPPLDRLFLEIPTNMRDINNEPPKQTAERELIKKIKLRAGRIKLLTHFHNTYELTDTKTHIYLTTNLKPTPHDHQKPKKQTMTIHHLSLTKTIKTVLRNEITNTKTITNLLLTKQLLHEREKR